ncbi:efflux RND transporter periplasmic adaptor subunit [Vreelandella zhanjiangensis]|uniref:efflux RND transporter periplasmic adaptor subunit n=1 Tax=Vreelandella zhanjiangensis TaxID=1121960 RepID=UPI000374A167|nr:efflux RND transporter periplasmic adaptor subunit [Halomonas zhanjiangensis]
MPALSRTIPALSIFFVVSACLLLSACSEPAAQEEADPIPSVTVEILKAAPLRVTTDLSGRLTASRVAEVRARVSGIVLERTYQEGSFIEKGDALFQIDPGPLQVAVDSARAALNKAEANRVEASQKEQRLQRLLGNNAISRQDYDSARALSQQAAADVASAEAELARARLDLGYATVTAPISGRIGRAQVSEGALVGQNEATLLATIQQLDPIYADITQSADQYTAMRHANDAGSEAVDIEVALIQPDDANLKGRLLFSELSVDQSTGQIMLRSEFPNSELDLLPGAFVQVRVPVRHLEKGMTVAQRAVQLDGAGKPMAMVVSENGQVVKRRLTLGSVHGGRWIVLEGLREGERIVVSGLQQIAPGMAVTVESSPDSPASDDTSSRAGETL